MDKVTLETLYKCYNIKMEELLLNPIDLTKEKLLTTDLNVNRMIRNSIQDLWKIDSSISTFNDFSDINKIKPLHKEIEGIFNSEDNPIINFCKLHFIVPEERDKDNRKDKNNIMALFKNMHLTADKILFFINKRIEFTEDVYPPYTEEQKKSQILLTNSLEKFCSVYNLKMLNIPE